MCLYVNDSNMKPKVAKENITCYKVLEEYSTDNGVSFHTPFRFMDVELGKTYVDDNEVIIKKSECNGNSYGTIKSGVFHSFKEYIDAVSLLEKVGVCDPVFVVECVIPKGTEYYEGTFDDGEPCYGSKTIQYKEKILAKYFWSNEYNKYLTEYPNSDAEFV